MSKRKAKFSKKTFFLKFIGIIFIASVLAFLIKVLPGLITIKTISCLSQFGPCNQSLANSLEELSGQSLPDTKKALKIILAESVVVNQYSIQFLIPNKIKVDVVENKPVFAMKNPDRQRIVLITKEGYVISEHEETNLPVVETKESLPKLAAAVDERTLFALSLVYGTNNLAQIKVATLESDRLELRLVNELKVVFPLAGDADVLLGSLNLILSRLNSEDEEFRIEEGKNVVSIDLRFKNPVIK